MLNSKPLAIYTMQGKDYLFNSIEKNATNLAKNSALNSWHKCK